MGDGMVGWWGRRCLIESFSISEGPCVFVFFYVGLFGIRHFGFFYIYLLSSFILFWLLFCTMGYRLWGFIFFTGSRCYEITLFLLPTSTYYLSIKILLL
ncbi:hypothetical protein K440DRAFT_102913 [Wilcoxina mikolae CBS 423.85]|nr:hypothetical protein K440DRAFT_102913 [Wilcoxina mikolae CBS 423.85]